MLRQIQKYMLAFALLSLATGARVLVAQTQTAPPPTGQTRTPPDEIDPITGQKKQEAPARPVDPLVERDKAIRRLKDPNATDRETDEKDSLEFRSAKPKDAKLKDDDVVVVEPGAPGRGEADLTKEYTGPAVLSRSYAVQRSSLPENVKFRPYAGVSFVTDTGLQGLNTVNGATNSGLLLGSTFIFGIEGRHTSRHDILQLNYNGNVARYVPTSPYNGSNHAFSLNWTHVLSRRLRLSFLNNTSFYTASYNLTTPVQGPDINIANTNLALTPNVQVFDDSTIQSTNSVSLTWQRSARMSMNFSASYFFISRGNTALVSTRGLQFGNDLSYRFTRKTTLGVYYSHTVYQYNHGAGNTTGNSGGLLYSYALNSRTELRVRAGMSVLQNFGIVSVSIDPAVAALLGRSSGLIQSYVVTNASDVSASLNKTLRGDRNLHLSFTKGTTPGNGVFIASQQQTIEGGMNLLFLRKYRVSLNGARTSLDSISQQVGQYKSDTVHFGVSRSLFRHTQSDIGMEYRHFVITDSPMLRNQFRFTVGISWSNGDFPARVF